MNKKFLFLGAALGVLCLAVSASAQTVASNNTAASGNMTVAMNNAPVEQVVVYGQGQTRQVQTVPQEDIIAAAPGTSPLKVIAKLPGVNFQSADPFGAYEWSARISIRGFNQNQLGFTLDGVPLGDMSYGNDNGLHISRAISSENIGSVELAQGTGALGTASTSNLGGTLEFRSSAPLDDFGVQVASTYGSNDTYHEFVRLDTGTLPTGATAYLSYGLQHSHKWKGEGTQKQYQINGKIVQPIGPVTLTGFLNYSDRAENDYQDMSMAMIKRLGYRWDNISNNWPLMVQVAEVYQNQAALAGGGAEPYPGAGTTFPAPFQTVDDAYANASGLRKDTLGGVTADWSITPDLTFKATGYYHHNNGQGIWFSPYVPTPGGGPIALRTTEYQIKREGTIASLTWALGSHTIEGGLWYENNDFNQARRYYGLGLAAPGRNSLDFQANPFYTQWAFVFNTETLVFHLQDDWQITDALKLNFGFKTQDVTNKANAVTGTAFNGTINSNDNFLPQVGVNYKISDISEAFADFAENREAFVSAATSGPFSTSQAGFNAIKGKLKPESSKTYEAGYRFHNDTVQGVIAAYYVEFQNRLLATSAGAAIVGNPSVLSNVGGVTTKGIEAAGTWRFAPDFWLFGSYAYNDSTYDQNVLDGSGSIVMYTAHKTVVDAPKHILNAELGYDNGSLFGRVNVSYMSKRYYSYQNDASVPSRFLTDLSLGYRFTGNDLLNGLEIQGNIYNLFDKQYVSTVGSTGFVASGDAQTLLPGSPRTFFVTLRKQF
ncbi:MAG: TonB-dependent receptor [Alphaproteobacteria bacterium]|nr:TonB-dependent receptor [Alphaproteobacteria bacterium]MDE2071843.1 TonB-dependent receptor [Alphaproteobacteria bacterium]